MQLISYRIHHHTGRDWHAGVEDGGLPGAETALHPARRHRRDHRSLDQVDRVRPAAVGLLQVLLHEPAYDRMKALNRPGTVEGPA